MLTIKFAFLIILMMKMATFPGGTSQLLVALLERASQTFFLPDITGLENYPIAMEQSRQQESTKITTTQSVTEIQPYQVSSLKLAFKPIFLSSSTLLFSS